MLGLLREREPKEEDNTYIVDGITFIVSKSLSGKYRTVRVKESERHGFIVSPV